MAPGKLPDIFGEYKRNKLSCRSFKVEMYKKFFHMRISHGGKLARIGSHKRWVVM